jgi:hypothetical protein
LLVRRDVELGTCEDEGDVRAVVPDLGYPLLDGDVTPPTKVVNAIKPWLVVGLVLEQRRGRVARTRDLTRRKDRGSLRLKHTMNTSVPA